jgi:hypothetical protein
MLSGQPLSLKRLETFGGYLTLKNLLMAVAANRAVQPANREAVPKKLFLPCALV